MRGCLFIFMSNKKRTEIYKISVDKTYKLYCPRYSPTIYNQYVCVW